MIQPNQRSQRRGAVLLLVLVMVPMLALGAYTLAYWTRLEAQAANYAVEQAQTRWLAESGIAYTQSLLSETTVFEPTQMDLLYNDPVQFSAQSVFTDAAGRQGFFTIIAPPRNANEGSIRFGLSNECGRFPLHNRNLTMQSEALLRLPGMTAEIADSLLDWLDADDNPRQSGAESSYYLTLDPPYRPRNGPPASIGELLFVKGMTPTLLYGEDTNLDGILNANEDDGDSSWPPDNADGVLDPGLYAFFTVYSAAANTNPAGEKKLNLNDQDVATVTAKLTELFDQATAAFILAYRNEKKTIKAVTELINAEARVGQMPLRSPWREENAGDYLDKALSELSTADTETLPGRIDLTAAPPEVIALLPDLPEEVVSALASAAAQRDGTDTSAAWLLVDKLVTLDQFRGLEPLLTGSTRVFRLQVVGFYEQGGPMARIEAVINAGLSPPAILFWRDLTALGNNYDRSQLMGN